MDIISRGEVTCWFTNLTRISRNLKLVVCLGSLLLSSRELEAPPTLH